MKSFFNTFSLGKAASIVMAIAIVLFATHLLRAVWVEPQTASTGSDVAAPVTETGINQTKGGKLGINGTPSSSFDFLVNGAAIFQGGVRAGSGFFGGDVLVGNAVPSDVQVYGDLRVLGTPGKIKNAALAHSESAPQPVCSNASGVLALCGTTTPPPASCTPITVAPWDCGFTEAGGFGGAARDSVACNAVSNTANIKVNHFQVQSQVSGMVYSMTSGPSLGTGPASGGAEEGYVWNGDPAEKNSLQPFRIRAVDGACTGPFSDYFGPLSGGGGDL